MKYSEITADTGLTEAAINAIKRQMDSMQKMENLGIAKVARPSPAAQKALGRQELLKLNDEVYRRFVGLISDAGLPVSEIGSLGKMLVAAGSDDDKLAILARVRTDLEPQIVEKRLTGSNKPAPARQLRQHLGFIAPFSGKETELVEANLSKGEEHAEAIDAAIEVLTEVARLQMIRNSEINQED